VKKGISPLKLARSTHFSQLGIDWSELTLEDITETTETGYTLLHYAARDGYWDKIPKKWQDKKYWQETKSGTTVLISAYLGDRQEWIDKKSLTTQDILKRDDRGHSVATLAAKNTRFFQIPKNIVTLEVLKQKISPEDDDTILHTLARTGQLSCLSKKFLTEEVLSLRGNDGETIYHIVAEENISHHIPKNLWTRTAVTLQADSGRTPLHPLCACNSDLIPPDVTLKDLLIATDGKSTPLHCWAASGEWVKIPNKFLTQETLELAGDKGETPLNSIVEEYKVVKTWKGWGLKEEYLKVESKFALILSKVSEKTLKKIQKVKDPILEQPLNQELARRKLLKSFNFNQETSIDL